LEIKKLGVREGGIRQKEGNKEAKRLRGREAKKHPRFLKLPRSTIGLTSRHNARVGKEGEGKGGILSEVGVRRRCCS